MSKSTTLVLSLMLAAGAPALARADDSAAPPAPPAPANETPAQPNGNMKTRTPGQVLDDSAITTKITSQLVGDPATKARHIDVTTRKGVVTLRGEVESNDERVRAVQIARGTKGVASVDDNLTVGHP